MYSNSNQCKRFLRDGELDQMIKHLRRWDREMNKSKTIHSPSLAPLIQLFESNRLILKQIENQIEINKQKGDSSTKELKILAHLIQSGLKNSFEGVLDEKGNLDLHESIKLKVPISLWEQKR